MTNPEQSEAASGQGSVQTTSAIDLVMETVHTGDAAIDDQTRAAIQTTVKTWESLRKQGRMPEKLDKRAIDSMIAEYDRQLSAQIDEILHNEQFQELESTWRGLKHLVDKTNFDENIEIEILNASKEELVEDFEHNSVTKDSGLYKKVFTEEFGQFGGSPWGAVIGGFSFGPNSRDMKLLQNVAAVSAMAHAPFISAAGSDFFGRQSFQGLSDIKDIKDVFDAPAYTKWRAFRESDDARWVGLTLPRFLLRLPYSEDDNPVKEFNYAEDVSEDHDSYLWGNYCLSACPVRP